MRVSTIGLPADASYKLQDEFIDHWRLELIVLLAG